MSNGTCTKCGGEIDDDCVAMTRRLYERKGSEYRPPRVCTICLWLALTLMRDEPKTEEAR